MKKLLSGATTDISLKMGGAHGAAVAKNAY